MIIRSWIWTLPLLAVGLLPGQTSAQRGLVRNPYEISYLTPTKGNIRWTGNRLVGCDFCTGRPILFTVDRQGNREDVAFNIPEGGFTVVEDLAPGPDGSLAVVENAISGDSRMGTFVAWISPDRARQIITRVWPYSPNVVAIAPDGTIWTVGAVMNDNYVQVYPNVLRHYTPSGQLLASTIISHVRRSNGGLYKVSDASVLIVSNDRVGWLTFACQYIEFSFDAVDLGHYACPNGFRQLLDVSGVALSSADDLLVGGKWLAPLAPLQLDRATGTWKPVPVLQDSGKTQKLLGFDGLTLVTSSMSSAMHRYTWSDELPVGGQ